MNVRSAVLRYAGIIASSAAAALGISMFLAPNDIAAGGFSGAATIIRSLTGLPVGMTVILLNLPVFLLAFKKLGAAFLINSVIGTVSLSVFIDLFGAAAHYEGDKMLAALFGGIITGGGLGAVFLLGATTGGVDIIAKLLNMRFMHLPVGRLMLMIDGVVIATAAVVYGNIESALYAAVAIYAQSVVTDKLVYGADKGKIYLINSKESGSIAKSIVGDLGRGATVISAKGAYSGESVGLILCAVRRHETAAVMKIIKKNDPEAFTVSFEAGEIRGRGFLKN